jgi:hypothetical protein
MDGLDFDTWVKQLFEEEEQGGYLSHVLNSSLARGADVPLEHATVALGYVTRLFEEGAWVLADYRTWLIGRGLDSLLVSSGSAFEDMLVADDERISWDERARCIRAVYTFFADVLAPRLDGQPERPPEQYPLWGTCFMWWGEYWPLCLADAVARRETLATVERILSLDSRPCQESCLHGLGHWHLHWPDEVEPIVDRFLASHPKLPRPVREYAEQARCGAVQ